MKKIITLLFLFVIISGTLSLERSFSAGIIQGDPFESPPKGTSPNCGPEDRYKFDVVIHSKTEFVDFLKENKINNYWFKLDNFKEGVQSEINWDKVLSSIEVNRIGNRVVYSLQYNPESCSGFIFRMTNDGYASLYGCCGK